MNVSSQSQPKRTIKVKDFLNDFHAGVDDHQLMEKYHLTVTGIGRFYDMLQDRGILTEADFDARAAMEDTPQEPVAETTNNAYLCESCGIGQNSVFDICPNCGADPNGNSFATIDTRTVAHEQAEPPQFGDDFAEPYMAPSQAPLDFSLDSGQPYPAEKEDEFDPGSVDFSESVVTCDKCDRPLDPVIRVIYDRARSLKSLYIAAGVFLLSFLTASSLHFFEGYSYARLVVIYATVAAFLVGSVFLGVGVFMMLAREKVYQCGSCLRIYPRA